jgi:hypothetical protein
MKKLLLTTLMALLFSGVSYAQNFLVTDQEMNSSNEAAIDLTPKLVPEKDAPLIELVSPNIADNVASPTLIRLKFTPTAPAIVDPKSFKALYGSFQINITDRLLSYAEVTDVGITVKEAKLPSGNHKMLLQVTDNAGRVGFKTIEFTVK